MTTITSTTAVDDLLAAFADGAGFAVAHLYAEDAVLDATVPGWRMEVRGSHAIAEQYTGWFADPGQFEELERRSTPDGEVVTYLLRWVEDGVGHAAHHCHVLTVGSDGRITRDVVFCGGRWNEGLLARMRGAQNA